MTERMLLNGNEAVATAALDAGVGLGTGYPGTPSTEILEHFSEIGGRAQWAPNEKVALEVGLGACFGGADVLVTMKHVGVNVAADPLFTAAYTGVTGGLVLISADDPGMASSQNEQDNRHYARAAGVPMLEPADSQEAYDMTRLGLELSRRFGMIFILRMTTRICHSKTIVQRSEPTEPATIPYQKDIPTRVMIPAYARGAHKKLRDKLARLAEWNEAEGPNPIHPGSGELGIITSGISYVHAREAAPEAGICKLGLTWPLPIETIRSFAADYDRVVVIEEGDPVVVESLRAEGIDVEGKDAMYRFGELSVDRVTRILAGDTSPEPAPPKGKPPQLCPGCPHRNVFEILRDEGCIVAGDIGCYTLGVLPPFEAMDTCVCMGASIGVGLGLRHVLPEEQAAKVVSVIGDSTFAHSGLTGLAEMVYNPPETGHVVIILDNNTTAMTGLQEHPGTGRKLDHTPANQVVFEDVARAMGIKNVTVMNPSSETEKFAEEVRAALKRRELSLIIGRRPCLLAAGKIKQYQAAAEGCE
ncbi:MAG: thiamine pyrophosphate-dependent enzyme [Phycisphaerae bacterium]